MPGSPSNVLVLANHCGFVEREVADYLGDLGHQVSLLRTDTRKLVLPSGEHDFQLPAWDPEALPPDEYDRRYRAELARLTTAVSARLIFAIGMDAAMIGATKSDLPLVCFFGPLDLAFAKSRHRVLERFLRIEGRAFAHVCENLLIEHSLVDKGSRKPQFFWRPYRYVPEDEDQPTATPDKLIVFSETWHRRPALTKGEHETLAASTAGLGVELFGLDRGRRNRKNSSFRFSDLELEGNARELLRGALCVLVGDSNDHAAVAAAALRAGAPVFLEDTVHNALLARHLPGVVLAARPQILSELPELLRSWAASSARRWRREPRPDRARFLDLEHVSSLPWYHEELDVTENQSPCGPAVVFGSVTGFPLERTRARAVRIQALLAAHLREHPVILLQPHSSILERRRHLLEAMAKDGRLRYAYFESGTSPISTDYHDDFFALLSELRRLGVPVGWFARDAHYLEDDFGDDERHRQLLLELGRSEARLLSTHVDRVFAPTERLFERMVAGGLYEQESKRALFVPLPPGVREPEGPLSVARIRSRREPVTILYSGGASDSVYRMELYHAVVKRFLRSRRLRFVFMSRPDELEILRRPYSSRQQRRIQFLTGRLEDYLPDTALTFGVCFFEHPYGKDTVPLKLYSYLGLGYPVLAYDDCSYSSFIEERGLGITCAPDKRALKELFRRIERAESLEFELAEFVKENTWQQRVAQIRQSLASGRSK